MKTNHWHVLVTPNFNFQEYLEITGSSVLREVKFLVEGDRKIESFDLEYEEEQSFIVLNDQRYELSDFEQTEKCLWKFIPWPDDTSGFLVIVAECDGDSPIHKFIESGKRRV